MEQFEDRVLLSIGSTTSESDALWNQTLGQMIERASDLTRYSTEQLAGVTKWAVGVSDPASAVQLANSLGADLLGPAPNLPNGFVWQFAGQHSAQEISQRLKSATGVTYEYPLVTVKPSLYLIPNDPLFVDQWHLLNTGQGGGLVGADANVTPAWNAVTGTGVVIGIVDDEVELTHPDLAPHYRSDLDYDFNFNDPDPSPDNPLDNHGTSVAGVAAAAGNNAIGVTGAGFEAELAGLRLISSDPNAAFNDPLLATALDYNNQSIDIYNNSWGFPAPLVDGIFYPMGVAALRNGALNGRGGLGNIYLFAAGNSGATQDNVNYHAFQNSRYVIAVGAIDNLGVSSWYSTPGAAVLVSAYSNGGSLGITTTDRTGDDGYNATGVADGDPLADTNYTSTFGGTSSATPLVSGIVALMLEANPNLSWRDVQVILATTAKKIDGTDPGWSQNGAGLWVNDKYGFGAVDAAAAVAAAQTWKSLGPEVNLQASEQNLNITIPGNANPNGITRTVTLGSNIGLIERVEVQVDIVMPVGNTGDLEIQLVSPQGTVSQLTTAHSDTFNTGYPLWTFTTTHDLNEASGGDWRLIVKNPNSAVTGTLRSWTLTVHGTQEPGVGPELISVIPNEGGMITEGVVLTVAPQEITLRFSEGQKIDAATLDAIQLVRAGGDGQFGATSPSQDMFVLAGSVAANPWQGQGWRGIGDRQNEVILRFAEALPDDVYQLQIVGSGLSPLKNLRGQAFHEEQDLTLGFELDLAPQIVAVVPQPVTRDPATGQLQQSRDTIEVYFNNDTLSTSGGTSATNVQFYTLIAINAPGDPLDDVPVNPTQVVYDPQNNKAVLTFADDLFNLGGTSYLGDRTFRLRIGDQYQVITTTELSPVSDPGSSFLASYDVQQAAGNAFTGGAAQALVISSSIDPQAYNLEFPGSKDTPGSRELPDHFTGGLIIEDHYIGGADLSGGVDTYTYNFQAIYAGSGPTAMYNQITEAQKQRAREIFELYSHYLGVQFIETAASGLTIVTGDVRVLGNVPTGPGGVGGIAGGGMAIMNNAIDWGASEFGGGWFGVAMHEIGHLLGYGHSYDAPPGTIMGSSEDPNYAAGNSEPVFPGDWDIVMGQYMHRPDSNDIDAYKFTLTTAGELSAETIAERLQNASSLNTLITLYDGNHKAIARNDDYFGKDSLVDLHLAPGTYYVVVTASGNSDFNPEVENSGLGGTTQGVYDLRLNFQPDATVALSDADHLPTQLDGDGDGTPGGDYNFWFNTQTATHTLFVDKQRPTTPSGAQGSLTNPYTTISSAFAAAQPGDIVRIVGNNIDNDNRGRTVLAVAGSQIVDGNTFAVSDGKQTVVFEFDKDAPPKFQLGSVRVAFTSTDTAADIASSVAKAINGAKTSRGLLVSATVAGTSVELAGQTVIFDRQAGPLKTTLEDNVAYEIGTSQTGRVLADGAKMEVPRGVTVMIDAGAVFKLRGANIDVGSSAEQIDRSLGAVQVLGTPQHSVYFTSYQDQLTGNDTETLVTTPAKGDWGGLVFRNDLDYAGMEQNPGRRVLETSGVFLDYVNHADVRWGGGRVTVNGVSSVYDPIHMIEARPTLSYNTISHSADAAMSADPNSFLESKFQSGSDTSSAGKLYTADYGRVGPDVHGNHLADNSVNGLFVRIRTNAGVPLDTLDVPGRFDDADIVYVVPENLLVTGTPGGPIVDAGTCPLTASDTQITAVAASRNVGGTWQQVIDDGDYFSINDGFTTVVFEFDNNGQVAAGRVPVTLGVLDTAGQVAQAVSNAIQTAITTKGLSVTISNNFPSVTVVGAVVHLEGFTTTQGRPHARLAIDPGVVVKLNGSRIETQIGAQFIAEGTQSHPIIFTSMFDDRYGAGGTFDTSNDKDRTSPRAGDWASLNFGPISQASIDWARVFYGGGSAAIEGGFAGFDPIEIRQAVARVTNTLFEDNGANSAGDRNGRGFIGPATIYIRGAQPIIVGNTFRDNQGAVASINVNALNSFVLRDWGRSTGPISDFAQYDGNYGPLVRDNRFAGNGVNGMVVRGAQLTTEVIWDDTDIAHVVYDEIVVPNFYIYGGIRLQSSADASLVVKLSGADAGFTASGRPLEIDNRIGGEVQIVGTPGHPVVLTSLADDSISAGFDPQDQPQYDTNNNGLSAGNPGDWRSIRLDRYSNDRSVAVIDELENPIGSNGDTNGAPGTAQALGTLATKLTGGDSSQRLGFEVHGYIASANPSEQDVYSFSAAVGQEVWIDIDRTAFAMDTVVEMVDADGNVLAWSDNSFAETAPASRTEDGHGLARPMAGSSWSIKDFYSQNPLDAGMRVVLPGPAGQVQTYYVRVQAAVRTIQSVSGSALADGETFTLSDGIPSLSGSVTYHSITFEFDSNGAFTNGRVAVPFTVNSTAAQVAQAIRTAINTARSTYGLRLTGTVVDNTVVLQPSQAGVAGTLIGFDPGTSPLARLNPAGEYQLQVRLQELQEIPGSIVSHALVAYATNGIEVQGLPNSSPLVGESAETTANNDTQAGSQQIGNILASNQETLAAGGSFSGASDVDFYRFGLDIQAVQQILGVNDQGSAWPLQFDVDYADGMGRPDTSLYVFDSNGKMVYASGSTAWYNKNAVVPVYTPGTTNIADDLPAPNSATGGKDELANGSFGTGDPSIGTVYLREGTNMFYDVALTTQGTIPIPLIPTLSGGAHNPGYQPLLRREPVDSLQRITEDHIGSQNGSAIATDAKYEMFTGTSAVELNTYADDFHLGDVTLYVNSPDDLYTVDAFTGAMETNVCNSYPNTNQHLNGYTTYDYNDIAMRNDGHLVSIGSNSGPFVEFNTGNATQVVSSQNVGITPGEESPPTNGVSTQSRNVPNNPTWQTQAMTFDPSTAITGRYVLMVANMNQPAANYNPNPPTENPLPITNLLYVLRPNGTAVQGYLNTGGAASGARNISDIVPFGDLNLDDQGNPVAIITGMAAIGQNIYVVAQDGKLYQLNRVNITSSDPRNWNWGFVGADNLQAPDTQGNLQTLGPNLLHRPGGPTLTFIGNVSYQGNPIPFSGLATGPQTVEPDAITGLGKYRNMLFATATADAGNPTDPYGHIYAFDPTKVTAGLVPLEPIFLDAQTRVPTTGVINPQGLAFSPIDYNLWHVTNRRGSDWFSGGAAADRGHGIEDTASFETSRALRGQGGTYPVPGGTSFYFGLEDPRPNATISNQPGASNFIDSSSSTFYTYDLPGGAYGSLTTNSFSLAGYDPADKPVLYFNYFVDNNNAGSNDQFRVFLSTGNVAGTSEWQQLGFTKYDTDVAANSGTAANGWRQARMDLSAYAGYPNLRLRFDFSTAADIQVGTYTWTGSSGAESGSNLWTGTILQAIPGVRLRDGNYFMVSDPSMNVGDAGGSTVRFEFDMGYALVMPNVAGMAIADGETVRITDKNGSSHTFEFDNNGAWNAANVRISLAASDSAAVVARHLANAINTAFGAGNAFAVVDAAHPDRVFLKTAADYAAAVVRGGVPTPAVVVEGDAPGTVTPGAQPIPVRGDMTASQVATAIAEAMDRKFSNWNGTGTAPETSAKLDAQAGIVHMIGHQVTSLLPAIGTLPSTGLAPLSYSTTLPGDDTNAPGDRFRDYARGQDNHYEGVYLDDIIIGFTERGEMITGNTADSSFYTLTGMGLINPQPIMTGDYQLEIRRGQDYGVLSGTAFPILGLTNAYDTNDRFTDAYALLVPEAAMIPQGGSFTIGDGVNKATFRFLDPNKPLPGDTSGIPIYFTGRETGAQMAALVVTAINRVNTIQVTASSITAQTAGDGGSSLVELFGAKWVELNDLGGIIAGQVPPIQLVAPGPIVLPPQDDAPSVLENFGFDFEFYGNVYQQFYVNNNGNITFQAALPNYIPSGFPQNTPIVAPFWADVDTRNGGEVRLATGTSLRGNPFVQVDWVNVGYFSLHNDKTDSFTLYIEDDPGGDLVGFFYHDMHWTTGDIDGQSGFGGTGAQIGFDSGNQVDYLSVGRPKSQTDLNALLALGQYTFRVVPSSGSSWSGQTVLAFGDNYAGSATGVRVIPMARGDANHDRPQGWVILEDNQVTNCSGYGVVVDAAARDTSANWAHPASVLPLVVPNTQRLVPGITIDNNVIAFNGAGGIHFSGDPNATGPLAAVPFGWIVNNTIYGQSGTVTGRGTGILVDQNASPTIVNNIVANLDQGISVDNTSGTTVVGTTVYQNNAADVVGLPNLGTFPLTPAPTDPLFVDAANGNFYPDVASVAIDSSLDSLGDRPALVSVRAPLGIPASPILAPDRDLYGQLRIDDPTVAPPSGMGGNIFKDRGAIDRVDFAGPTGALVDPLDNDPAGIDRNPSPNDVLVVGSLLTQFAIQLSDKDGVGIADGTVTPAAVEVRKDGVLLALNLDYLFAYNATNDVISLYPAAGVWAQSSTYTILLTPAIRDLANNPIQPNRADGTTQFTVTLSALDYGDAPDPTYPSLKANDGARHIIFPDLPGVPGFYLGAAITSEPDANQNATATGDSGDDGVVFGAPLKAATTVPVQITVSGAGTNIGKIDAWIDFNGDGDWSDPGEQIFASQSVNGGLNNLSIVVPASATYGWTFARFRLSKAGGLGVTGEAPDGEVEDYRVRVVQFLEDFGDAPDGPYPTLLEHDGPSHQLDPSKPHLGAMIDADSDGQPSPRADADKYDDGVQFDWTTPMVPGQVGHVTVNASGPGSFLNAWMDFNGRSAWEPTEQIAFFKSYDRATDTLSDPLTGPLAAGNNELYFRVPLGAKLGYTFSRFRLCSDAAEIALPSGAAKDGEVEDYRVLVIDVPIDYGDAPDPPYPTLKADHGARHAVDFVHYLGATVDYEPDGQPNSTATGDSGDDGVQVIKDVSIPGDPLPVENRLLPDRVAEIVVTASAPGVLSAWIDFNNDGDWTDFYFGPAGDFTKNQGDHVAFYTDDTLTATTVNKHLVAGENHLKFYVPKSVGASTTFARFRFSDQENLSFQGPDVAPLPVGEVEDYQVEIVVGDAQINGYKFNDLNANGRWDRQFLGAEPGLAGVTVYLDLNNDGIWDAGEPSTVTRADDLGTPATNETGYYEFTKLLPGPYVVREVIPDHWSNPLASDSAQTYPYYGADSRLGHAGIQTVGGSQLSDGQTFTLSDGTSTLTFEFDRDLGGGVGNGVGPGHFPVVFSFFDSPDDVATSIEAAINGVGTGYNVSATATNDVVSLTGPKVTFRVPTQTPALGLVNLGEANLNAGDTVTDVNFGNYRAAHVSVSDVAVAEGNQGTTQVNVTLHITESFGAPVRFNYATANGTATTGDGDYQARAGTFTFTPQSAPAAQWDIKLVTHNLTNDYNYSIWEDKVVYQGSSAVDNEIYLYDDATGVTRQISESSLDNCFATIYGSNVVWAGKANDGSDFEIFRYDISTGVITRLTNNDFDDKNPQLSERFVTWWAASPGGMDSIYVYDLQNPARGPVKISDDAFNNTDPRVSGSHVVWSGTQAGVSHIFFWDGTFSPSGTPTPPLQLTSGSSVNTRPQIDGDNVVWQSLSLSGGTNQISWWDGTFQFGGRPTAPKQISAAGVDNTVPQISGNNVVWQGVSTFFGTQLSQIECYDLSGSTQPVVISGRDPLGNPYRDEAPQISGNRVVWSGYQGSDWQSDWDVFYYEIGGGIAPVNASNNDYLDGGPLVSDKLVIWRSFRNGTSEVVRAVQLPAEVTKTITLTVNGDLRMEPDETFFLNLTSPTLAILDDTQVTITILNDDGPLDFGDAPDPTYPTLLADNGARHAVLPGVYLGSGVNTEKDGKPSLQANADANDDGVVFDTPLTTDLPAQITVTASVDGYLDAWIDFSGDGTWNDWLDRWSDPQTDHIFVSEPVVAGQNVLSFAVPRDARPGTTYARFRFRTTSDPISFTGMVMDGEVEDYVVQIASNVVRQGKTVIATGGWGDNVYKFWAGPKYVVSLNGIVTKYNPADVSAFTFTGGAGRDTVYLYGDPQNETAQLYPDHATLSSSLYNVSVSTVDAITATGGGGSDTAVMYDGPGGDTFTGRPTYATLTGPGGVSLRVNNFPTVIANAIPGGQDIAWLYDSAGDDTFHAYPSYAVLSGTGFSNRVNDFRYATAKATLGGTDAASFFDSTGSDTFTTYPAYATMTGKYRPAGALTDRSYYNRAEGFGTYDGTSASGGTDLAKLYDSPTGNDRFVATPTQGTLTGVGLYSRATGFRYLSAYATGGTDTARLDDSAGTDTFVATPDYGVMYAAASANNPAYANRATGFDALDAFSTHGGDDTARLYDSAGDDIFTAAPTYAKIQNDPATNSASYVVNAHTFRYAHAFATAGGTDKATLTDSPGTDTFEARPAYAILSNTTPGQAFYNRANYFEQVFGVSSLGGNDMARLYDSAGKDTLQASPTSATLSGTGFSNQAQNFRYVTAYASTGGDEAHLTGSSGDDKFYGSGSTARLYDAAMAAYLLDVRSFQNVDVAGGAGTNTRTIILPIDYALTFTDTWGGDPWP